MFSLSYIFLFFAAVAQFLGLAFKSAPCCGVLGQLAACMERFTEYTERPFLTPGSVNLATGLPSAHASTDMTSNRLFITKLTKEVYKFLDDKVSVESSDGKAIRESPLAGKPWIWQGDRFVTAEVTAIKTDLAEHKPYFYRIPETLTNCPMLCKAWGVVEMHAVDYYLKVMEKLHRVYGRRKAREDHCKLLIKATEILVEQCRLSKPASGDSLTPTVDVTRIVLPSMDDCPRYTTDLHYYDTPWIPVEDIDSKTITFVSTDVSYSTACAVGIERGRHGLVDSDDLGEDFGQEESLVDRLTGILEKYPPNVSIFKELVQNADDAGATMIHFVLDTRCSHPTDRLLNDSDAWKSLQERPALCVFNDRPFSEEDIKGISQLGRGSKRDDPLSTGRFGIGFNAVYHLTDCPSFLSRGEHGKAENLCVFDPLCAYEPRATTRKPGRRYRLNETSEQRFGDQFRPYLADTLSEVSRAPIGSTVFRLPLRMPRERLKTLPAGRCWLPDDLLKLLLDFKSEGGEMLLFLNHLRSLRVSVIDDKRGVMSLLDVSAEVHQSAVTLPALIRTKKPTVQQLTSKIRSGTVSLILHEKEDHRGAVSMETLLSAQRVDKTILTTPWLIHRSVGVRPHGKATTATDGNGRTDVSQLNMPFAAYDIPSSEAVEKALEHGLLPRAGVAAPLPALANGDPGPPRILAGHAFCTLPTQITTGLPVHIDGHFTLDDSRKHLEFVRSSSFPEFSHLPVQAWWNFWLQRHALAPAFGQLLLEARQHVVAKIEDNIEEDQSPPVDCFSVPLPESPPVDCFSVPLPDSDSDEESSFGEPEPSRTAGKAPPQSPQNVQEGPSSSKGTLEEAAKASHDWFYTLFPRAEKCTDRTYWAHLCRELYRHLAATNAPVLSSYQNPRTWLPIVGEDCGIFHQHHAGQSVLFKLLLDIGMRLSSAPYHLFHELKQANIREVQEVSPELVTTYVRSQKQRFIAEQALGKASASDQLVAELLLYCLETWTSARPLPRRTAHEDERRTAHEQGHMQSEDGSPDHDDMADLNTILDGLPLLLMENGQLTTFSLTRPVIVTDFVDLLPNCTSQLMKDGLQKRVKNAFAGVLQNDPRRPCVVAPLTVHKVAENIPRDWPCLKLSHGPPRLLPWNPGNVRLKKWLLRLWSFLNNHSTAWKMAQNAMASFCLVPVSVHKVDSLQLLAMSDVHLAICSSQYSDEALVQSFWKLGLPKITFDRLFTTDQSYLHKQSLYTLIADQVSKSTVRLTDCSQVVLALRVSQSSGFHGDLNIDEAKLVTNHLVHYFGNARRQLGTEDVRTLSRLRIYQAVSGALVSLVTIDKFFEVVPRMPTSACNVWETHGNIQVLKAMGEPLQVFLKEKLHKHQLSTAEVYVESILPCLLKMNEEARLEHLDYVRTSVLPGCNQEEEKLLLASLRTIPFVGCRAGCELKIVPCLFSPKEDVLKEFISEEFLVEERWLEPKWYAFLKKLQLNVKMNQELFLQCAKAVEIAAHRLKNTLPPHLKQLTEEGARSASELLISSAKPIFKSLEKHFNTNSLDRRSEQDSKRDEALKFLLNLRDIRFVYCQNASLATPEILRGILGEHAVNLFKFVDQNAPVKISGSALSSHSVLLWSQQPVLPFSMSSHLLSNFCRPLEVSSSPSVEIVVRHLMALSTALTTPDCRLSEQSKQGSEARTYLCDEAFAQVYGFLNDVVKEKESQQCIRLLKTHPCILVNEGQALLPPAQVTLRLADSSEQELLPHLAEVPEHFQMFLPLMECLGVTKVPSAAQYAEVLKALFAATNGQYFTNASRPNDFVKVREASRQLVSVLRKEERTRESAKRAKATNGANSTKLPDLYLPVNSVSESDHSSPDSRNRCRLVPASNAIFNNTLRLSQRIKEFKQIEYLLQWEVDKERRLEKLPIALGVRTLSQAVDEQMLSDLTERINFVWDSEQSACPPVLIYNQILKLHQLIRSVQFGQGVARILRHLKKEKTCDRNLEQLRVCRFVVVRTIKTVLYFKPIDGGQEVMIPGSERDQPCHFKRRPKLTVFVRHVENEPPKGFMREVYRTISRLATGDTNAIDLMYDLCECVPESVHSKLNEKEVERFGEETPPALEQDPPLGAEVPRDLLNLAEAATQPFAKGEYAVYEVPGRVPSSFILVRILEEVTTKEEAARGPLHRRFLIQVNMEGAEEVVTVLNLFKYVESDDPDDTAEPVSNDTQLVLRPENASSGAASSEATGKRNEHSDEPSSTLTFEEAKKIIRKEVSDIYQLDKSERKKAYRRLCLKWHPDKNPPEAKDVYTKAFQFLQNEKEHWEKHGRGSPPDETEGTYQKRSSQNTRSGSSNDWGDWWKDFHEGQSHRTSSRSRRRRRKRSWQSDWWRSHTRTDGFSQSTTYGTTSLREASRWLHQSESDLVLVKHHQEQCTLASYAQACFLAQQVAEKALKAGLYASHRGIFPEMLRSNDTSSLAMHLRSQSSCRSIAESAGLVASYFSSTRYPGFGQTYLPCELYSGEAAALALQACTHVLDEVRAFVRQQQQST